VNHMRYQTLGRMGLIMLLVSLSMAPACAIADCKQKIVTELQVTMFGLRPMVTGKLNGDVVQFIADSGAFYSLISPASAAEHHVDLKPYGFGLKGLGGLVATKVAIAKNFTLGDLSLHDIAFLVGGSEAGAGSVGVLGQNVFHLGDTEYDLAHGVIRLIHVDGCENYTPAYWISPGQPYSVIGIESTTARSPHTAGVAFLNGEKIKIWFDTGAPTSILSMKAAARAGIKPDAPDVVVAGYSTGFGQGQRKTYIARFASLKIGDEEIRNARLRFGDLGVDIDMLIGSDFFLSHRIYVANSQQKLLFTYNGGPVFNLTGAPPVAAAAEPVAGATSEKRADPDGPENAAAFSRRGAAFAARLDFEHALADLNRAVELEPSNSEYFYERGIIYLRSNQPESAKADFDHAIGLNPDHVQALMNRAEMRIRAKDIQGATQDLEAIDQVIAKQADLRFEMARDYERADLLPAAIAQYDAWISFHAVDSKFAIALNNRCWARALLGVELSKAMEDCDRALKLAARGSPFQARVLSGRGLTKLRLGDYRLSIADYNATLKVLPKDAWALYGRGIASLRKGKTTQGQADTAEAIKIAPDIEEQFKKYGIDR
jgi:tetratricopeptide (TPR) repeat protein/predicted aspartyl protease